MTANEQPNPVARAVELIRSAARLCVLSGAGISAESGVPTFRGAGGRWEGYDPAELATPQAFARDPALVWRFYNHRRLHLRACRPNPGHHALARFEKCAGSFALITQNVDGLHQRADSKNVIELHGNIWIDRCSRCAHRHDAFDKPPQDDPRCPDCGARLRPGVVWFGESLPPSALADAEAAAHDCDLMLVIGTSALVYPAGGLPLLVRRRGRPVLEINPHPTTISDQCSLVLQGPAGVLLPWLLQPV